MYRQILFVDVRPGYHPLWETVRYCQQTAPTTSTGRTDPMDISVGPDVILCDFFAKIDFFCLIQLVQLL